MFSSVILKRVNVHCVCKEEREKRIIREFKFLQVQIFIQSFYLAQSVYSLDYLCAGLRIAVTPERRLEHLSLCAALTMLRR